VIRRKFPVTYLNNCMRKLIFPLAAGIAAAVIAGCAGPDQKLGRGLSNTSELVRWGELRHEVEENSILKRPGYGYYGVVHGVQRSIARAGLGVYEVATFPIPSYSPIMTDQFSPDPVYPLSYKPGTLSDALFDTDTYTGFSGGDVAPFIPGSRFKVFDN
jgi:putative exosortase-associated protein (TIGR04073 family)